MRINAEQILAEVENLKTIERKYYLNGSDVLKGIWSDLERHTKHLKTVLKAGDFDDLGEREIPLLIEKIKVKKSDWLALVSIEKSREVISAASETELTNAKYRVAKEVGNQRAAMRAPPQKTSIAHDLTEWLELNRSNIESFCATTFIVIAIQLAMNVFLLNQVRVTTQLSVIDPLEQQLQMTQAKNIEMAKRISNMKKEVSLYRSIMKNMPFGTQSKKTSKFKIESLESLGLVIPENNAMISMSIDPSWAD